MTEEQLTRLTQQSMWLGYAFLAGCLLFAFFYSRNKDGVRRWDAYRAYFFTARAVNTSERAGVDYDDEGDDEPAADDAPVRAFERAEPALFVPPVQLPNAPALGELDIARIDTLARLMAAGAVSESTAITAVWDGRGGVVRVSKGGSKAYTDRRDALRALALHYGWQAPAPDPPPEPARQIPINDGKHGFVEI